MRSLALVLTLCCSVSLAGLASTTNVEGVWVAEGIEWSPLPGDHDTPPAQTAEAEILFFNAGGKFQLMDCYLIRSADGSLAISNGDPRKVSAGRWSQDNDVIKVTFQVVEVTVPFVGQTLPGPLRNGTVLIDRDRNLRFEGKTFQRTDRLDR